MPDTPKWNVIGTYRTAPLPFIPLSPTPKGSYISKQPRKSIVSYIPIVLQPVKEIKTDLTRWRS
jgi:hypothetical protein